MIFAVRIHSYIGVYIRSFRKIKNMLRFVIFLVFAVLTNARHKMSQRTFKNPLRAHPKDLVPVVTSEAHRQQIASSFPKTFDWCDKGFCHPAWNQHIPQVIFLVSNLSHKYYISATLSICFLWFSIVGVVLCMARCQRIKTVH